MKAWYTTIGKLSAFYINAALFAYFGISVLINGAPEKSAWQAVSPIAWVLIVLSAGIYLYLNANFDKVWKYFFPPIVFLWGEEIENNKRMTNLRKELFWGVIVTTVIGIIITMIF